MSFIGLFLLVLAAFGFIAVLLGFVGMSTGRRQNRSRLQNKHSLLNPIRSRFGAENLRPSRFGEFNVFRPALVFDYGRTMARLKHFGKPWSQVSQSTVLETSFALPTAQHELTIASRDAEGRRKPTESVLETDDDEFDQQFFVYTNDPTVAKQLLTDAVKWKVIELNKLHQQPMSIQLESGLLKTTTQHWFGNGQDLLDFVQTALELFDQLMLHNAEGVEFLHQNQAAVIEQFHCPICSDDVMHEMVVCRRCKTPHCAECWEYNGKCATFACMEERCIRVEVQEL